MQQAVFYTATPLDYLVAAVLGLVASTVAGFIMGRVGIFLALILGGVVGGAIAEIVRWATRRRRGQWMWLVVSGCIVAGALLAALYPVLISLIALQAAPSVLISMLLRIDLIVYVALAIAAAYARLR
jgi:hypothetical protein